MKVEVDSIDEAGLVKKEDIEASSWDMDGPDTKFVKEINICCEFRKIRDEIMVKAVVSTSREVICGRCLEAAVKQITQEFHLSYDKKKLGQFLEVDEEIRQEIILNWPMKPLCKDDCKGICPGCGKNLNIEECSCQR